MKKKKGSSEFWKNKPKYYKTYYKYRVTKKIIETRLLKAVGVRSESGGPMN